MIIFLGIAGSGKSVQAKLLATTLDCDYLSLGQFLRDHADEDTKAKLLRGELLPDIEVIKIVTQVLSKIPRSKEFILDGFPRTINQAKWLINSFDTKDTKVFHLIVDAEIIIERLRLRDRQDDTLESIQNRINEYEKFIDPVIDELKSKSIKVFKIDGSKSIKEVHNLIAADFHNSGE
jgi:adenylate kinase